MRLFLSGADQQSGHADDFGAVESAQHFRVRSLPEKKSKVWPLSVSNVLPNASGLDRSASNRIARNTAASAGVSRRI
jgi:hypothetical protein